MPRATYPSLEMWIISGLGDSQGFETGSRIARTGPFVLPAWHLYRPEVEDQRRGRSAVPALQCGAHPTLRRPRDVAVLRDLSRRGRASFDEHFSEDADASRGVWQRLLAFTRCLAPR